MVLGSYTMFGLDQRPTMTLGQANDGDLEPPLFRTDEFRIFCMKVLPCSKRYCHDWTTCPFSHPSEKARRRDPRLFNYTGIACPDMKKDNTCVRGDQCPYAHNVFEYWLHPTRYRTQLCNDGLGCRRRVCFFAHTLQELRVPSSKPFVDPETLAAVTTTAAANEAAKAEDALKMQRAGSVGVARKDAALAALSSQLAGLQLHAGAGGVGRRASMPEPLAGGAAGQADPAVVQVLQALLRQASVQQQLQQHQNQSRALPAAQRGMAMGGDALARASSGNHSANADSMPTDVSRELPSSDQLAALYASMDYQQARWQQQYAAQQQQSNGRPAETPRQSLDGYSHRSQSYEDTAAQQDLLDQGAWRQQSTSLQQSFMGLGSSTQATPRGSLELGESMAAGWGVRGNDAGVAGMPAYTTDYAGNIWTGGQQLYRSQPDDGASFASLASARRSADYPRQLSLNSQLSVDASRRVSADEVRRGSLDVGAGMHNATYQQVYQQAYQHVRVLPQQLYQSSSLYAAASNDDTDGRHVPTDGETAATDQAPTTPPFNVDTFGESLVTSNRSMFQPAHSQSDHSSPSPDSTRRHSGDAAPFKSSSSPTKKQQHLQQQGGPPRQGSASLPPWPESAAPGGMAAFAGYSTVLESAAVGSVAAPISSAWLSTVADNDHSRSSPPRREPSQSLAPMPECREA